MVSPLCASDVLGQSLYARVAAERIRGGQSARPPDSARAMGQDGDNAGMDGRHAAAAEPGAGGARRRRRRQHTTVALGASLLGGIVTFLYFRYVDVAPASPARARELIFSGVAFALLGAIGLFAQPPLAPAPAPPPHGIPPRRSTSASASAPCSCPMPSRW
jgi:hypothetical protein